MRTWKFRGRLPFFFFSSNDGYEFKRERERGDQSIVDFDNKEKDEEKRSQHNDTQGLRLSTSNR